MKDVWTSCEVQFDKNNSKCNEMKFQEVSIYIQINSVTAKISGQ